MNIAKHGFKPITNQIVFSTYSSPKTVFLIGLTLVFIFYSSFVYALCENIYITGGMNPSDCEALEQIYNATNGPNWRKNGQPIWDSPSNGPRCGNNLIVYCDHSRPFGQRPVISVNLSGVGMDGILPGSAFTQLPSLTGLNLSNNDLKGNIPVQLADIPSLGALTLSYNGFTGTIPDELLGENGTYTTLNLEYNQLSGTLPNSLGNNDVRKFSVRSNSNITGPIQQTYIDEFRPHSMLDIRETEICEPQDQEMQAWLASIASEYYYTTPKNTCENPPLTDSPGYIIASDGISTKYITVDWESVNADDYVLQRAEGKKPPFNWVNIGNDQLSSNRFVDTAAKNATWYSYRVAACKGDECSEYTNSDAGHKALEPPTPLSVSFLPGKDDPESIFFMWSSVPGAEEYRLFVVFNEGYYPSLDSDRTNIKVMHIKQLERYFFTLSRDSAVSKGVWSRITDGHHAVGVFAVANVNGYIYSNTAMWNSLFPPTGPAINLLLNKRKINP